MKAKNVRSVKGQPFTRKKYIHGIPRPRIEKFEMGREDSDYDVSVTLNTNEKVKVTDRSLKAVRTSINRNLERPLDKEYFLKMETYLHHTIRENRFMVGAGADRLQEGMRRSFGKPTGRAAIVDEEQPILTVKTFEENLSKVEKALRIAKSKIPKGAHIKVESSNGG